MADKCLIRVEKLLKKSSIAGTKKEEIVNLIKQSIAEKKLSNIDEVNVDVVAKDVSEQIKLQKKINKRNAIENEIKVRRLTELVLTEFSDDPLEGLTAIMVGSNNRVVAARSSAAVQQNATVNQLIVGFNAKLRAAGVDDLFDKGLDGISEAEVQRRVTRTMYELSSEQTVTQQRIGEKPRVTETNPDIIKLAEIMESYSEMIRQKLNDRGANIQKLWGYIVKQSHDPSSIRNAAAILGVKNIETDPSLKLKKDINYNKNFLAWKNYVMNKLDTDRTFANTDNVDEFMIDVYNSLVGNKYLIADGVGNSYGTRTSQDVAKGSKFKRVLHFKTADDWFDYNDKFGVGNLKESFFSGLQTAGRNLGIIDALGTKPKENIDKIRFAVHDRLKKSGKDVGDIKNFRKLDKYMKVIDGSIYTVENFGVARYSAIARTLASMARLGGATISALADVGIYGSEVRYQGRSFLGGMFEALSSLGRIKNTKQKKGIAEMLGFINDNTIYDMSARHQVGDNLNKGWTKAQRTFFKLNLLSWWTNSLKEGAMLGLANYFARQKNLEFKNLNKQLQELFTMYDINPTKWDIIRKTAMEKADDGKEFINIALLDQVSDADLKKITGLEKMTERQMRIEREKFKASVSGILLDRSLYAVIEPDARVKGFMTQGALAGTLWGESIRFFGQFKAFPISIVQKVLGREMDYFKGRKQGDLGRGIKGMAALMVTSAMLGYMSMTIKDILKGRSPREIMGEDGDVNFKTLLAALLQGGGLGIYGDVLFKEVRDKMAIIGGLAGPIPVTAADVLMAIIHGTRLEGGKAGKSAYDAVTAMIPFYNLFYIKSAFDYLIGFQIMETIKPGILERIENRMEKDYNQHFLFTKPSTMFKGFN
nr:putative internal virion protein [uncultured Mediterranean phage uvMED]